MNPQQYYGGQFEVPGSNNVRSKRFGRTQLLIGLLAVLVIFAIIAGLLSATTGSNADKLMSLAIKGDAVKSYALFSAETKKEYTEERWKSEVSVLSNLYQGYKLDKKSTATVGDEKVTTYRFVLTPKNADSKTNAWTIVKYIEGKGDKAGISSYLYKSS